MTIPNINQFPRCDAARRTWLASLQVGHEVLWIRSDGPLVVKVSSLGGGVLTVDSPLIPRGPRRQFTPKTGIGKAGQYSTDGYILPVNEETKREAERMRHCKEVRAKLHRMFWGNVPDDKIEQIEAILGDQLKAD